MLGTCCRHSSGQVPAHATILPAFGGDLVMALNKHFMFYMACVPVPVVPQAAACFAVSCVQACMQQAVPQTNTQTDLTCAHVLTVKATLINAWHAEIGLPACRKQRVCDPHCYTGLVTLMCEQQHEQHGLLGLRPRELNHQHLGQSFLLLTCCCVWTVASMPSAAANGRVLLQDST